MARIRSVRCHRIAEDIGTVVLEEVDLPPPRADEVQVRLKACAVNFPDILMIQGKYQFKPPLPFAPGGEAAGDVVAVGPGVTQHKVGDAVVVAIRYGGFSEAVNVSARAAQAIPAHMSYAKAAAFQTAYLTAYVALVPRGNLQPAKRCWYTGRPAASDSRRSISAKCWAPSSSPPAAPTRSSL